MQYYEVKFMDDPISAMELFKTANINMEGGILSSNGSIITFDGNNANEAILRLSEIVSVSRVIVVDTKPVPGSLLAEIRKLGDIDIKHAYFIEGDRVVIRPE